MASTTEALTDLELSALREAAAVFVPPPRYFRGMNARGYIEFFLRTGVHPSVLAHPTRHDLKVEYRRGRMVVSWLRPKKKGLAARTDTVLEPEYEFLKEFVAEVSKSPSSDRQITMFVSAIGKAAGISGTVSPRTLRHTCGVLMLRRSRNPAVVKEKLNVSDRTLQHYLRLTNDEADRAIEGFLPAVKP